MISEVTIFLCSENQLHVKLAYQEKKSLQKVQANHVFESILVPEQCTGMFKVSSAWTNAWNKMMEKIPG